MLPPYLIAQYELDADIGDSGFTKAVGKLINMNDSEGCTFNDIADWIEKNL